jgi:hypothetical protein
LKESQLKETDTIILGDLYTGITTDVDRRFANHQAGGKKSARCLHRLLHLYIRRHFRYNVIIRFTATCHYGG